MTRPTVSPPRHFFRLRSRAEEKAERPAEIRSLATRAYAKYRIVRPELRALRRDIPTLVRLARAFATGTYRQIPWKAIVSVIAALLYFVVPFDAIPDFIPIIGYLDDAVVVAYVMRLLHFEIAQFKAWEADRAPLPAPGTS